MTRRASSADPIAVLHTTPVWLAQTKTWIHEQIRFLPSDVEAHVVCAKTRNLDQFPVARLHSLEALPRWRRGMESLARRARIDSLRHVVHIAALTGARVLHSHFGPQAWRDMPLARAAGLRQVVTFYGYDVTQLPVQKSWRDRYRQLFSGVDRVLCEGPHMREELIKLGCAPDKVWVHHLGIDLARIPFRPRSWTPNEELGILIAGSFREKKGIPFALQALAEVVRARPNIRLRIEIVGDAGSEPNSQREKQNILKAVQDGGLGGFIRMHGYQSHKTLLAIATRCHLFVSPNVHAEDGDSEGGAPVTIIETAASGMPVVSTTHCDIPNVLRGPARNLLVPERDPTGLARVIIQLTETPTAWSPLLSFVRCDVEDRFDAKTQGEQLARHYRDLSARTRRRSSTWSSLLSLRRALARD